MKENTANPAMPVRTIPRVVGFFTMLPIGPSDRTMRSVSLIILLLIQLLLFDLFSTMNPLPFTIVFSEPFTILDAIRGPIRQKLFM
jgi:hypothetical protein